MVDRHVRGHVRTIDANCARADPNQLAVELWLTDHRNGEQYVRWRAAHYLAGELVTGLDIRPGDDVEVALVVDRRGECTSRSCIANHTRASEYALNRGPRRWWPLGWGR